MLASFDKGSRAALIMTVPRTVRSDLHDYVESALPKGELFQVLHMQSFPKRTGNIVVDDKKANKKALTVKAEHFFTLAQNDVILFGMEVYVYIIANTFNGFDNPDDITRLIYVGKVDSTGLNEKRVLLTGVVRGILKYLIGLNVTHYTSYFLDRALASKHQAESLASLSTKRLLEALISSISKETSEVELPPRNVTLCSLCRAQNLANKKIVTKIALFTRSEKQYLFPLSYKNKNKHILSDRELLHWWLRVLDSLVHDKAVFQPGAYGTLAIPGEDRFDINKFISKLNRDPADRKWRLGGGLEQDMPNAALKAVYHIPLLPDDPKGRFLEHLVVEGRVHNTSLRQFWDELAFRQEFRLANIVGIINIEGVTCHNDTFLLADYNRPSDDKSETTYFTKDGVEVIQLKVRDFPEHHIVINNFADDLIIVTDKRLKNLKRYIVGEQYNRIDNAKHAFENISFLLNTECNYRYRRFIKPAQQSTTNGFKPVKGQMDYALLKSSALGVKRLLEDGDKKPITILSVKSRKDKRRTTPRTTEK